MSDSKPLVSVIVPTYNGAKRIAATLKSIINQDYENLEIVLVNDASTDDTLNIAEKVLKNSGRKFKIINHEKNLGVSPARNTGFDASSGEYVIFFDHDDLAEKNYVSSLLNKILEDDCDISFCGFVDRYEDGRPDKFWQVKIENSKILNADEALNFRIENKTPISMWCAMFKRKFLEKYNLRFCDKAFEDIAFLLRTFCRAEKISFVRDCLYIYVHSPEMTSLRSVDTREKKLRRYTDGSYAQERLAEYLSTYAPSERTKFLADYLIMPEAIVSKFTVESRKNDRTAYDNLCKDKRLREILKRSRKTFFRKPEVFLKSLMILLMPGLYFKLRSRE